MDTIDTSDIDAVVTWVDGNDPTHQHKRNAVLANLAGRTDSPIAAGRDPTRFQDNGELRYCLASIRKFAPWIRRIHLITDNQRPDFLDDETLQAWNIKIVDHREIFESYEWALPTFNSRSIETAMWRIPDLAPRFLYLNDDFLITQPATPDTFFSDEKVILRGNWRPLTSFGRYRIILNRVINYAAKRILRRTRTMHLLAQMKAAQLAGFQHEYFQSPHVPHPIQTDTLASFFAKHRDVFEKNIGFRFRDMNQFWSISLANHLEIRNGTALFDLRFDAKFINGERDSASSIKRVLAAVRDGEALFLCIGSLERIQPSIRIELENTLAVLLQQQS